MQSLLIRSHALSLAHEEEEPPPRVVQEDQQGHSKPVVAPQGLKEDHHPEALVGAAHGTSLGTDEAGTHEIWIKDLVVDQLLRDSRGREQQSQEVVTSGPTLPEELLGTEAA